MMLGEFGQEPTNHKMWMHEVENGTNDQWEQDQTLLLRGGFPILCGPYLNLACTLAATANALILERKPG